MSIPASSGFKGHPDSQLILRGNISSGVNLNFIEHQILHSLIIDRTGLETVNLSSNLSVQNTLNFTNGNLQVGANTLTLNGAFHTGFPDNLRTTDASNLVLNCTNTGSVTLSNFTSLNHLTINSSSLTYVVPVNLTINGNLSLQNGSLDISGQSVTVQGSISGVSGQLISNNTSDLTLTGSGDWTLPNNILNTGSVLRNLTLNRTNTITWNNQNLTLHGDITITSGGLDIASTTFSRNESGGTFTLSANGVLSLSGNDNFPSLFGTYSLHPTSRVRFYGQAQEIPHLGSNYGHVDLFGSGIKTLADGMVVSGDFTLNENAVSAIAPNQVLTVGGGVKRLGDSSFTVSNDAYLIQTGTSNANEGSVLVQRQAQIRRLDFVMWSSPVIGQTLLSLSPNTLSNRFLRYSEDSNNWEIISNPSIQTMESGIGYSIRAPNNHPTTVTPFMGNFNGVIRSGNISVAVTKDASTPGFNLVGNPYPSALDLVAFHAANSTRIQKNFYFYEHTLTSANLDGSNTNYGVLAIGSTIEPITPNVYVRATNSDVDEDEFASQARAQVGQGFFVRANSSGNVNFTNAMRVAGPATFLGLGTLSESEPQYDLMRLQLTNPAGDRNETVIGFFQSSIAELDAMDTPGFGTPSVYSRLGTSRLAIQGLPYPLQPQTVVPIGYRSTLSGLFKIELTEKLGQIDQGVWVWLHDLQTDNYHNLSLNPYEFNSDSGQFDERFLVLFTQVLSAPDFASAFGLSVFPERGILTVKSTAPMREIKVFDVQGRLILQRFAHSEMRLGLEQLSKIESLLLVEVTTDSGAKVTQKVVY